MIAVACSLCILGALTITYIVVKLNDLSSLGAFLLSWLAVMFIAAGLKVKESSQPGTAAFKFTKFVSFFAALLALYPAVMAFPTAWRNAAGFGSKAFLVWLVLLALMLLSVIVQAGEQRGEGDSPPPPTG